MHTVIHIFFFTASCPARNILDHMLSSLYALEVGKSSQCVDLCFSDDDCKEPGMICCPGTKCGHMCWKPNGNLFATYDNPNYKC